MSRYVLRCLLCQSEQPVLVPPDASDLAAYQEHAMQAHGLSQEALAAARRAYCPTGISVVYVWTLTDGRPWLRAEQLLGLFKAGLAAGYPPQALAPALELSLDILAKLDARAIVGASIPVRLLNQLAAVLNVSQELVEAYLDAPPADSPFRCGPCPQQPLGKELFWQSISQSPFLTNEQEAEWLARIDLEGKR